MKKRDNDAIIKDLLPSRDELVYKAESLRRIYGPSWVTNVATYLALLEMKREKGIYPLRPMKKSELKQYPQIDFMEIKSDKKARTYLSTMNAGQIFRLIEEIEMALVSYPYITIQNKIKDFRSEINRKGHKNTYGINPDCVGARRGLKTRSDGYSRSVDISK